MAYAGPRERIAHMIEAIDDIRAFTQGKIYGDYKSNRLLRLGVERAVEKLSEASRHLPDTLKQQAPSTPWRKIAGVGNILRHDYEGIDDRAMWGIVEHDLEPLRRVLESLLLVVDRS